MARQFILLDRDGTLIEEKHYLSDPDQVELIPGVVEGLRRLNGIGLGLVVITNQSGVGRGFFGQKQVELVHQRMCELLEAEGVRLDGIYVCPHAPEQGCGCRKPAIGLVEQAAQDLGFTPWECFVVGDKACDIELGQRLRATTFLVRTGYGVRVIADNAIVPDFTIERIGEMVPVIECLLKEVKGWYRSGG